MTPIEAVYKKDQTSIFCRYLRVNQTLAAVFLPVLFLEGFVGRLFREFGVVIEQPY
jgi:HAE1 family hydrophobic/amphiphilic exporter-1/multidrug efflux pump